MSERNLKTSLAEPSLIDLCADQIRIVPSQYFSWQRGVDLTLACLLLIPGLPLMGIIAILVRTTSRGPAVFRQVRVGRRGKLFTMYKFRSMVQDAEARTGPVWCQSNDPRITRLGYWLRRLHLDELPQLFNVLRGDMALLGPRPERPEFVRVLIDQIPGYLDRVAVRPGVTGLAQINLPPDSDLASVRRKQMLDIEYIRTASFGLDLRMLLATLLRVVGLRGTTVIWLMRLARPVEQLELELVGQIESKPMVARPDTVGRSSSVSDSGILRKKPAAVRN